jgi:hypothetical protein
MKQHESLLILSLSIHYYLTGRTNISSDFVSVGTNSVDYISNVLVVNSAISKCIKEMVNEKSKVVFSYTSAMVDMTKGFTRISDRAIKSRTKELSLHATLLNS